MQETSRTGKNHLEMARSTLEGAEQLSIPKLLSLLLSDNILYSIYIDYEKVRTTIQLHLPWTALYLRHRWPFLPRMNARSAVPKCGSTTT